MVDDVDRRPFTFDEAELRMRRVLAEAGYAQPDEVTAGPGESEITFAWEGHDRPITMDASAYPERADVIEAFEDDQSVAAVTARMSKLIYDNGIPKPDLIREGPEPDEVSFIWTESKLIVIVDRSEDPDPSLLDDLAA